MFKKLSSIYLILCIISTMFLVTCTKSETHEGINEAELDRIVKSTPLEVKVGQMLMTTVPSTYISDDFAKAIRNYHIGGALLFQPNIVDSEQLVKLTDQIQRKAGDIPMFLALDQEGGRVSRIKDIEASPGHMVLGAANDPQLTYEVGKVIGEELRAHGINTNFAPVLDVLSNNNNYEIATRSFGSDPDKVSVLGLSFIKGLKEAGIIATAKHFPGHGATELDSHFNLPVVDMDKSKLNLQDIKPFKKAIENGVDMIMTAHVAYPALDKTEIIDYKTGKRMYYPATLSEKILTGILRKELGFNGVIVSDSMQMKAILDNFGPQEEAVVKAVKAGIDIIVVQTQLEQVFMRLLQAAGKGEIPETRINDSFKRIIKLKASNGIIKITDGKIYSGTDVLKPVDEKLSQLKINLEIIRKADIHQKAFEKAVTIVKDEAGIIPQKPEVLTNTLIFTTSEESLDSINKALSDAFPDKVESIKPDKKIVYKNQLKLSSEQKIAIDESRLVLLFTYSNGPKSRDSGKYWGASFPKDVKTYAASRNIPLVAVALGDPFDISYMPDTKVYMCIYGKGGQQDIETCIKTIFGLIKPGGKLPVSILDKDKKSVLFKYGTGKELDK